MKYRSDKKFLVDNSFLTTSLSLEVKKSFYESLERIRMAGATINEITIDEFTKASSLASTIFPFEAYKSWKGVIEKNPDKMYSPILLRFRGGLEIDPKNYANSWKELKNLRKSFSNKIHGFDALLSPTCPILPPEVKDLLEDEDYYTKCNLLSLRNTRLANMLGLTSITIPTEKNSCGLMLLAKPQHEQTILHAAKSLENLNR